MYIDKIKLNKEFELEEIKEKQKYVDILLSLFKEKKIKIAYSYDKETDSFTYHCYTQQLDDQLVYSSLKVDSSGSISYKKDEDVFAYSLCKYLLDIEKNKTPEELEKLYEGIDSNVLKSAFLSPEENKKRLTLRNSFLDMLGEKESIQEEPINFIATEIKLYLHTDSSIYGSDYFTSNIIFYISNKDRDKIPLFPKELLSSTSSILKKGKKRYRINYSLIENLVNPCLVIASKYANSNLNVRESELPDLISLFRGQTIYLNNKKYYVNEEINEGGISLKEDGSISLLPDLESSHETLLFSSSDKLVTSNEKSSLIKIYSFKSEKSKSIYSYIYDHQLGEKEISYIQDLVISKMKKEKGLKIIGSNSKYKIKYYVDYLSELEKLVFKTELYFDEEEISKENFIQSEFANEYYSSFEEEVNSLHGLLNGEIKDPLYVYAFLSSQYKDLSTYCNLYLSSNLANLTRSKGTSIKVKLDSKDGWINGDISSNEFSEEEIREIIESYKRKKEFVLIKDKLINLHDEEISSLVEINDLLKDSKGKKKEDLPFWTTFMLSSKKGIEVDLSSSLNDFVTDLANFKKNKLDLPKELSSVLRPYQKNGVKWLSTLNKYRLPALLADDMGLGKTLQTICFIKTLKQKGPVLIVCPKSVTYNWQKEIEKWAPELKSNVISGSVESRTKSLNEISKGTNEVFITSYETLRNDEDKYSSLSFLLLILDEAQNIKNPHAKKSFAVKSIQSKYRLALTGTPIENSAIDLFSIFDFLMEGYLGNEKEFFSRYGGVPDKEKSNELYNKIKPFYLRRKKEDVLSDLPPKTVEVVSIAMDEEESKIYKANLEKARIESNEGNPIAILATITKLRTICVDTPAFFEGANFISSKLQYSIDKIKQGLETGHKFIVFSSFTKVLHHLNELLNNENIPNKIIEGDTPAKERVSISEDFNKKNDFGVILVSLKAGGTGLNLYGADMVIHLDPWWNVAAEEQASDRAHRIGQTRPVTVYKLVAFNTIEEKVLKLQEIKAGIVSSLIKEGDAGITKLSKEDIKFLLS